MNYFGKDITPKSDKDYKRIKELAEALESWIEWDFFVTLTTSQLPYKNMAREKMKGFGNYFIDKLHKKCQAFWIAETQKSGNYHIHSLIETEDKEENSIKEAWNSQFGKKARETNHVEVEKYEKGKGGHIYILKNLTKPNVEYDFIL